LHRLPAAQQNKISSLGFENSMWFFSGRGDEGKTSLFDGRSIKKNDSILEFIGALDELTAFIGLAISYCDQEPIKTDLKKIQEILSKLMGIAAGAGSDVLIGKTFMSDTLKWIEDRIHYYGESLDNPHAFIFSGETRLGAYLDVARTITRRSERIAVSLFSEKKDLPVEIIGAVNRLSSFFYILRLFIDIQN
jgi:cob(I)alamin adenosyltransferase